MATGSGGDLQVDSRVLQDQITEKTQVRVPWETQEVSWILGKSLPRLEEGEHVGRGRNFKVQSLLVGTWRELESLGQDTVEAARRWALHTTPGCPSWPPCKTIVTLTTLQGLAAVTYNRLIIATVMAPGQGYNLSSDGQKRQKAGPGVF